MFRKFIANDSGATAIEYCLIAACISIIVVAAASQIGTKINTKFYGPLGGALN